MAGNYSEPRNHSVNALVRVVQKLLSAVVQKLLDTAAVFGYRTADEFDAKSI